MTAFPRLSLERVRAARARIAPHLDPTPLRLSATHTTTPLHLKLECWQPTGSFKVRGAFSKLTELRSDAVVKRVVTASAGNHALGVAHAAATLGAGLELTVFVPRHAPQTKRAKLARFPIEIREGGATYEAAEATAKRFAESVGAFYLHAFDDPDVAAGQGTVALEVHDALPDTSTLVVPVGGGGLISGCAAALAELAPDVRIVAAQAAASPALRASLERGVALLEYPSEPTLADGVAGGIGEVVFAHRDLIDDIVELSEEEIRHAIRQLIAHDQVIAEGAGALAVAAVLSGRVTGPSPTVAVVSGGNIDVDTLAPLLAA